jgi:hypothetical protein
VRSGKGEYGNRVSAVDFWFWSSISSVLSKKSVKKVLLCAPVFRSPVRGGRV